MAKKKSFEQQSYVSHAKHFSAYTDRGEKSGTAKTWFDETTVDAWRHQRMYELLSPLLNYDAASDWLTVGDGRFGKDAIYLQGHVRSALPTDISDVLLKEALQAGKISHFETQNAEALSFDDDTFDYVFCKESYHHFPRPPVALYEMLRVAKKGGCLIEPVDQQTIPRHPLSLIKLLTNTALRIFGKGKNKHEYEDSGNYVYGVSKREFEKVALGLNFPVVAFKPLNDVYIEGVEKEALSARGPLYRKIKWQMNLKNCLCKMGLIEYNLLCTIIFKQPPNGNVVKALEKAGFEIVSLPSNPYIAQ